MERPKNLQCLRCADDGRRVRLARCTLNLENDVIFCPVCSIGTRCRSAQEQYNNNEVVLVPVAVPIDFRELESRRWESLLEEMRFSLMRAVTNRDVVVILGVAFYSLLYNFDVVPSGSMMKTVKDFGSFVNMASISVLAHLAKYLNLPRYSVSYTFQCVHCKFNDRGILQHEIINLMDLNAVWPVKNSVSVSARCFHCGFPRNSKSVHIANYKAAAKSRLPVVVNSLTFDNQTGEGIVPEQCPAVAIEFGPQVNSREPVLLATVPNVLDSEWKCVKVSKDTHVQQVTKWPNLQNCIFGAFIGTASNCNEQ